MKHSSYTQICFSFQEKKLVTANFSGGQITSDAGLLPIREYDHRVEFTEKITEILTDRRVSYLIQHPLIDLIRQRLYGIIAGYEDCNDASHLRYDPVMMTIIGRKNLNELLASQPTLSRLENTVLAREVILLKGFLLHHYLKRLNRKRQNPKRIIIDSDSTDDPAHGLQQLALFNGFYDQHMYHPLLFFDGTTGELIGIRLRPGNVHGSHRFINEAKRIIKELKKRFPNAQLILRSDAAAASPLIYRELETSRVDYLIGLPINQVLKQKAARLIVKAKKGYEKTKRKVCYYTSFSYQAKSWHKNRRVLMKVEYSDKGLNLRFVVTSFRTGKAKELFDQYEDRGESENWIKEFKNGLFGDRLSCHNYIANAFRLMLHSLAYVLLHNFRLDVLKKTELTKATVETIRLKLIKVGALVKVSCRRIWFYLSESWPFRRIYLQVLKGLRLDTS